MRADGMIESMNGGRTDTKVRLRLAIIDQQDRRPALTHGWMMHNDVEVAFWRVLRVNNLFPELSLVAKVIKSFNLGAPCAREECRPGPQVLVR